MTHQVQPRTSLAQQYEASRRSETKQLVKILGISSAVTLAFATLGALCFLSANPLLLPVGIVCTGLTASCALFTLGALIMLIVLKANLLV